MILSLLFRRFVVCVSECEHIFSEDSKASELWGWKLFIVIDDSEKSELKVNSKWPS